MVDDEAKLDEIRRRWAAVSLAVQGWAALPGARRERVLAELEETVREISGWDAALAADLNVALDALDSMVQVGTLDLVALAASDVRMVLAALDKAAKRG